MKVFIAVVLLMALAFYYLYRNKASADFDLKILKLVDKAILRIPKAYNDEMLIKANTDMERLSQLYMKYSINDFLYSFKPLKMEYWFTEEELKLLGYENEHLNKD